MSQVKTYRDVGEAYTLHIPADIYTPGGWQAVVCFGAPSESGSQEVELPGLHATEGGAVDALHKWAGGRGLQLHTGMSKLLQMVIREDEAESSC